MRIWIVILAWAVISCNEIEDCKIESSQNFAIVQFFRADTVIPNNIAKEVGFDLMYVADRTFYYYAWEDSIEYRSNPYPPEDTVHFNDTTVTRFFLPLNPAEDSVTYIFETDTIDYELTMLYSKDIEIFYDECEPTYNYQLEGVRSVGFDTVILSNPSIDRRIKLNVEIYL